MSDSDQRSSPIMAYSLLFLCIVAIVLITQPLRTNLSKLNEKNTSLVQLIDNQKKQAFMKAKTEQELREKLGTLAQKGHLLVSSSSAETAESLQKVSKRALHVANAALLQMQHEQSSPSPHLLSHSLELSFSVQPHKLDDWFDKLASDQPSPLIQNLSLRKREFGERATLDAIGLVKLYSLVDESNWLNPEILKTKKDSLDSNRATLGGLFNPQVRNRENSGALSNYRISAISHSGKVSAVLLVDTLTGESSRIEQGESLQQWKLKEVKAHSATFMKNGVVQTLTL